jgi:flagellar hook-associated protein 3 FlgL
MRIATRNAFEAGLATLQRRQEELARSQEQLTTGKRVARAGDDPAAAARAERALAGMGRADTAKRSVDASATVMTLGEAALGDSISILQQAREALVAAGGGALGDPERRMFSEALQSLRDQLFEVANRGDGAGRYLFGGQGADSPPFVDAPGGVSFAGTPGITRTANGMPLALDGQATFLAVPTGNGVFETRAGAGVTQAWIGPGQVTDPSALTGSTYTVQFSVAGGATTYAILRDGAPTSVTAAPYTAGAAITVDGMSFEILGAPANGDSFDVVPSSGTGNIFTTLDTAAQALATGGRSAAQRAQTTSDALRDVDAALAVLQAQRTRAGEALNHADGETSRLDDLKLATQSERSAAEDLDMTAAISEFQNRQTGYDAALKSYSLVQRLSLFDYLR